MRLLRLTLRNVRGVSDRTLTFCESGATTGVVIVEGPNETGKSTLGDALDVLLAYKDRSSSADVRSLRTVGRDEPPEVEAELEVGEHRFTYYKRFIRRPATELTITAPRAETQQGDQAHERVEQLLDESLDLGLWKSLRLRQGRGLEQAGPGGSSGLATALAGHGDASAIGDRELAILEQVRREYERYHTARAGNETTLLKDARAQVRELTAQRDHLDGRRDELQEDIDLADRLARQLPHLRRQEEEAAQRSGELAEQRAAIEHLAQRVAEREQAVRHTGERLDNLTGRRDARTDLVAELEAVEAECAQLAEGLAEVEADREGAAERLETARAQLEEAQQAQREARAAREAAQHDLDHLRARAALEALRERWVRAEEALERLRRAQGEVERLTIDEELLATITEAQTDVTRAEAALEAASPQLRFTAAREIAVTADGEQELLEAGARRDWTVHGRLALQVGDVGEVEVRAGEGTGDAAATHREATARLRTALEQAGVDSRAAAETALQQRRDAERTAEEARRERETALGEHSADGLAEELDRLQRQVDAAAGQREGNAALPDGVEAARSVLDAAVAAERRADDALAEPEAAVERARTDQQARGERLVEQRTQTQAKRDRAAAIRAQLEQVRASVSDEDLDREAADAEHAHARALEELQTVRAEYQRAEPETVEAHAANAAEVAEDAAKRRRDAEQELRDTRTRIAALGGDGLWEQREEVATSLAHAEARLEGLLRRAGAAATLLETLERHRDLARERYAAPLKDQLLVYGRMLHGGEFDVELDDDLRVARRHLDGVWLESGDLSVGAREQLALLGRLACATLLGDQGGLLLFDDALGNTDPERLEAIGAVLRVAGEHCQVVVLTCYPDRYRHVGGATRITL